MAMVQAGNRESNENTRSSHSGALPQVDELARRCTIDGCSLGSEGIAPFLRQVFLSEPRHESPHDSNLGRNDSSGVVSKWRMKDRMKTVSVALVLCLNIGVDPPDVIKISPCARMECWIDPFSMPQPKALDSIGKNLQAQYERWQPRARYKMSLDPTVEETKKLCLSCRRNAKQERVLFHYNGHGVPRPTSNGEIWVFNKSYTQYIPLSVYDLQTWMGTPSIYVFDCSAAAMIVNAFVQFAEQRQREAEPLWEQQGGGASGHPRPVLSQASAMKGCILLGATQEKEQLPQNPILPGDIFTSCLTTPIKIALRWFCTRSLLKNSGLSTSLVDKIPGRQNDRKTPLGELNWIFTAITDTIAWNVLPRELFQQLFRQDLLVASLFRNFLLAERIMRSFNCTPVSYPRLPPTHQHAMWNAWDLAAEMCLAQLPTLINDASVEFQPSPFFTEQLTAFEVWLEHGSESKHPPEQLPIVLQVLLSQSHRLRALVLLGRFLDMGTWAVDLALSVGIFPYVLKLLQTTAAELRQILVFIWTKILVLDKSCQVDLVKDNGYIYFVKFLDSADVHAEQRAMAAFVLAVVCDGHPKGQQACMQGNVMSVCLMHLHSMMGHGAASYAASSSAFAAMGPGGGPLMSSAHFGNASAGTASSTSGADSEPLLRQWLLLALGKMWDGAPEVQAAALREDAAEIVAESLQAPQPEVRAAAVYALCMLVAVPGEFRTDPATLGERGAEPGWAGAPGGGAPPLSEEARQAGERSVVTHLLGVALDASTLVRTELAVATSRFVVAHNAPFRRAASAHLKPPTPGIASSTHAPSGLPTTTSSAVAVAAATPSSAAMLGSVAGGTVRKGVATSHARIFRLPSEDAINYSAAGGSARAAPATAGSADGSGMAAGADASAGGAPMLAEGAAGAGVPGMSVYMQVLSLIYTLARDPYPPVATLAAWSLRQLGVDISTIIPSEALRPSSRSVSGAVVGARGPAEGEQGVASTPSFGAGSEPTHVRSSSWSKLTGWGATGRPAIGPSSTSFSAYPSGSPSMSLHASMLEGANASGSAGGASGRDSGASSVSSTPSAAQLANMPVSASLFGHTSQIQVLQAAPPWLPATITGNPSPGLPPAAAPGSRSGSPPSTPIAASLPNAAAVASSGSSPAGSYGSHTAGSSFPAHMQQGGSAQQASQAGSAGGPGAAASSATGADSSPSLAPDAVAVPRSTLFEWSSRHFSSPLLQPHAAEEDVAFRTALARQEREASALKAISKCKHLRVTKMSEEVGSFSAEQQAIRSVLLHPRLPLVVAASAGDVIRVWNHDTGALVTKFADTGVQRGRVNSVQLLNEMDAGLLAVTTSDGSVRIWKNFTEAGQRPQLVTAWQAVSGHRPGARSLDAISEWQQHLGLLFAAGDLSTIRVWDVEREQFVEDMHTQTGSAVTCMSSSVAYGTGLVAGCSDGGILYFDMRTPSR
eukprot:jgi/Mesvir1/17823/Mv12917-RA.2